MSTSPELIAEVDRAFRLLESSLDITAMDLEGDFVDPGHEDFDPAEFELCADDPIVLQLPRCDDPGIETTYGALAAFAEEIAKSKLKDNLECWTPECLLVRAEHLGHYDGYRRLETLLGKEILQSANVNGCAYEISLVSGTTPFGFMVLKSGNWDKYLPPVLEDELFVSVRWHGKHDTKTAKFLVDSLIFELASSFEVYLHLAPRPAIDSNYYDGLSPPELRELRPLIEGEGMSEVLHLYTLAIGSSDPEFQIIGFVKVIEHISATVVREDLAAAVRAKLLSSRALDPDAEFILDLETVITSHTRLHRKDSDALRLTIQKCCDASELGRLAPEYLDIAGTRPETKDRERLNALAQFASSVSATRNAIVHAKLNYEKTGDECPPDQLEHLANTCRIASEQAIRWLGLQDVRVRVARSPQ